MLAAPSSSSSSSSSSIASSSASSSPTASPFIAVGLLSTAKGNTKAKNATVSLGRRAILRQTFAGFRPDLLDRLALRFLVARNKALNASSPIVLEAEREGDIIFLNMTEAKHRCSLKYYLWFKQASQLFPSASFFVLGDDDVYIQFAHLEADLRRVAMQTANQHVLYGLIMWKAYYNNNSMETSTGFTGWDYYDWAAVAQRRAMALCRRHTATLQGQNVPLNKSNAPACYIIRQDHRRAVLAGHMDPLPPFPYINGPLFGVSRSLGAMIASDPYPLRWLDQLQKTTATLQKAEKLWGFSCWPVGDSVLGYWVASVALRNKEPVTLVNTPFMSQHLPWPSWHFSNRSIVLHGLRTEKHATFRDAAAKASSGAFEPFDRNCGSCAAMGWTTWPRSPMNSWRCCGKKIEPGRRVRACVGKNCPKADKKMLLAVANAQYDDLETPGASGGALPAPAHDASRTEEAR